MLTINLFILVTSYIQEASAIPGREQITISCVTAESDPRVICNAVVNCGSDMPVVFHLQHGIPLNHTTTEPCNITISVFSVSNSSDPLEEMSFIHVTPITMVLPNGKELYSTSISLIQLQ